MHLTDIKNLVVIAGPNGVGKSTVFDAIRLLKSFYGGYQQDELRMWFDEFQVSLHKAGALDRLPRDANLPMVIKAQVELSASELEFLKRDALSLSRSIVWNRLIPPRGDGYRSPDQHAVENAHLIDQVAHEAAEIAAAIAAEIDSESHLLQVQVAGGVAAIRPSQTMSAIFGAFEPKHLGIIDYHGPQRFYGRESYVNQNVALVPQVDLMRNHALYNSQGKYANIKGELLSSYVRGLLADKAVGAASRDGQVQGLDAALMDLFATFIPDKRFLGIQPTAEGDAVFPVELADGVSHDIDDLSSGEKEVLYGYLRIRNTTPHSSILLLDEPELHLNPALARGLPGFYHSRFALEADDQVWFVTHSDAILREAFATANYSVVQMTGAAVGVENQAVLLSEDNLERALISMVGDLAAYRPRLKVLVLEGGGDADFDVTMVQRLFPHMASLVTLIGGGSRVRAAELTEMWQKISASSVDEDRFWVITDMDDPATARRGVNALTWNAYHIENYLLEPKYVLAAMQSTGLQASNSMTTARVQELLECIATSLSDELVRNRVVRSINDRIKDSVKIAGSPSESVSASLRSSLVASVSRLEGLIQEMSDEDFLDRQVGLFQLEVDAHTSKSGLLRAVPGREILKRFVNKHASWTSYTVLRNAIIHEMVREEFQPQGMVETLGNLGVALRPMDLEEEMGRTRAGSVRETS